MPNIKPVSELRNYNEVLKHCSNGEPVFLTKNGYGRYVIVDIEEYQRQKTTLELFSKLAEAEDSVKKEGWKTASDLKDLLEA